METTKKVPKKYAKPGRDPVQLTALLYLKEALLAERYEECAFIVGIAREFGATEGEVKALLEDPRRKPV